MSSKPDQSKSIRRAVWAIDAQERVDQTERRVIQTLRALTLASGLRLQIEPVHVLPAQPIMPDEVLLLHSVDLQKQVLAIVREKLKKVDLPGLLAPHVLYEPIFSTAQGAKVLIEYARERNAELIVVGTHARKGLLRLFLGSFAESLILHSSVPVLTVNPNSEAPTTIKRILFPTDFDKESHAVFSQVLEFARGFDARVTLFHKADRQYLEWRRDEIEQNAEELLWQATQAGVETGLYLTASDGPVVDAILRYAKSQEIQLIAMAARSRRLTSALAGSITRQLVRSSPYPVWVLREQAFAKARRKAAA